MIAFSCPRCAKPFQLKPEFAGRTTQCSGCKAPLLVPQATAVARDRIAFACGECGMKFSVPPECAGRATRCPSCKESLTVPRPDETLAAPPAAGQIHGAPSSLARAGVDAAVSLLADSGGCRSSPSSFTINNGNPTQFWQQWDAAHAK